MQGKYNKKAHKLYKFSTNSYYTNSLCLMNDVTEICIKYGYGITVSQRKKQVYRDVYNIHLLKSENFKVKKENIKIINNFFKQIEGCYAATR